MRGVCAKASLVLLALTLIGYAGPPAVAPADAAIAVPHITPVPDSYACGDEIFLVAFEAGVAYVTLPDGTMRGLPRQPSPGAPDPEALALFSNGHMAFTQEIEGDHAVRYAKGGADFLDCKRLP